MNYSQGIRRHVQWDFTAEVGIVHWGVGCPKIRNRGGLFGLYLPVKKTPVKGPLLIIPVLVLPSPDVHVCSGGVCLSK